MKRYGLLFLLLFLPSLAAAQTCPSGYARLPWGTLRDRSDGLHDYLCTDGDGSLIITNLQSLAIDGVQLASAYGGATAGAKIDAAETSLPSGGIIDARGLSGAQTLGNLTISTADITLLLGRGTYTGTITATGDRFRLVCLGNATRLTTAVAESTRTVTLNGSDDSEISGCEFQGSAPDQTTLEYGAVNVTGSSLRARIHDNTFTGSDGVKGYNIAVQLDGTVSGNSTHAEVYNNRFRQIIGTTVSTGYGVLANGSDYHDIHDNDFLYSNTQGRHGVYLGAGASFNRVHHNHFRYGTLSNIILGSLTSQDAVEGNLIDSNVLEDTDVTATAGTGAIHLARNVHRNVIRGNRIYSIAGNGISLLAQDGVANETPLDNLVEGNLIYNPTQRGIYNLGATRTAIKGNVVVGASQQGAGSFPAIGVNQTGSTSPTDCEVSGNTLNSANQSSGIQLGTSTGALVQGNTIGASTASPIVQSSDVGTILSGNILNSTSFVQAGGVNDRDLEATFGASAVRIVHAATSLSCASSAADNTIKTCTFATGHYDRENNPFLFLRTQSDSTDNTVQIGGGSASYAPATALSFFTATDAATPATGSTRLSINGAGTVNFAKGISNDGGGFKHARTAVTNCATSGCEITVTWGTTFADANYTPSCSILEATAQAETAGLRLAHFRTQTAAALTVDLDNLSAGTISGTLNCIAVHD